MWFSYFFLLRFDGSVVILSNTNITYNRTFVIFGGSLICHSYLTVPSSHQAGPTFFFTILLSYLTVAFFCHINWC